MNAQKPDQSSRNEQRSILVRLLRFSWQFRGRCLQVIIFQTIILVMGISGLGLTGLGIDYLRFALQGAEAPNWPFGIAPPETYSHQQVMIAIAVAVAGIALIRAVMNYFATLSVSRLVHVDIVVKLRGQVFEKLQKLSFRFFDHNASGTIINRVTSDVQQVRMFIDQVVVQVFLMVLSLVVYLVYMTQIHLGLTLACLATTPLLWITTAHFSRVMRPRYEYIRTLLDQLVLTFSEFIQGVQTVKGFSLEPHARKTFAKGNQEVRDHQQTIFWSVSTFGPFIGFLTQINLMILLGYGGWLVFQGEIPVGTGMVVFAGLLQQFSGQVANIAGVANSLQQSLTGARRVFEVLDSPVEVASPEDPIRIEKCRGEIRFEQVGFRFAPQNVVLEGIDFTVKPGEVVAIAGATGSGKSALMSLIPRFYDPLEGRILLDGQDLRALHLDDLRRQIGLVFQENFLFSMTVAENIAFGHPDATESQIEKAARIACADGFIRELPKGYDTVLREGGSNLSGGQRQRLAIARAILLEPAILLFDDPTAAIDPETEDEILRAIERAIEGRTTFIVAHRLSTLRRADRILVLKAGRLVQQGTHAALIEQPGLYQRAVSLQAVDPESLRLLEANVWNRRHFPST